MLISFMGRVSIGSLESGGESRNILERLQEALWRFQRCLGRLQEVLEGFLLGSDTEPMPNRDTPTMEQNDDFRKKHKIYLFAPKVPKKELRIQSEPWNLKRKLERF